jgi:hypothetical protein
MTLDAARVPANPVATFSIKTRRDCIMLLLSFS